MHVLVSELVLCLWLEFDLGFIFLCVFGLLLYQVSLRLMLLLVLCMDMVIVMVRGSRVTSGNRNVVTFTSRVMLELKVRLVLLMYLG